MYKNRMLKMAKKKRYSTYLVSFIFKNEDGSDQFNSLEFDMNGKITVEDVCDIIEGEYGYEEKEAIILSISKMEKSSKSRQIYESDDIERTLVENEYYKKKVKELESVIKEMKNEKN